MSDTLSKPATAMWLAQGRRSCCSACCTIVEVVPPSGQCPACGVFFGGAGPVNVLSNRDWIAVERSGLDYEEPLQAELEAAANAHKPSKPPRGERVFVAIMFVLVMLMAMMFSWWVFLAGSPIECSSEKTVTVSQSVIDLAGGDHAKIFEIEARRANPQLATNMEITVGGVIRDRNPGWQLGKPLVVYTDCPMADRIPRR